MRRTPEPQLAKLTRPRLHNAVARERLFAKLDAAREQRPAICVVGPPGAGKTTLVASWLDAGEIPGIWYQIDAGDGDLATLFYYLGEAAKPFARSPSLPALTAEYLHDIPGFSRRFFRDLFRRLPSGSVLVLDNYQEVPAEQRFHELIAEAVAEIPNGITLVCVSRRDPPDCYARLIVNEHVAFIDWEDLKLTLDEAQSIARARSQSDSALVRDVHARSGGWAAGMVLMLENLRLEDAKPGGSSEPQQTIFSYFAAQIFQRVPEEVREFLLATADLPWVEPELGDLLAGGSGAKRILDDLCGRHLFTHRRAGVKPSYQYHALFQTFLRALADTNLPEEKRIERRVRAAQYLERTGNVTEAFNLYRDAHVWTEAVELVSRHAPMLIAQGRFHTLSDWVGALPQGVADREPWLGYWHGRALVPFDPESGRRLLERAYEGFVRRADAIGEAVAAASIVESIYIGNRHFVAMDPWIAILERRLQALESLPSAAMELRMYSSALIAMLYRQPGNPLMARCLERLVALVEAEGEPDSRVSAAISVLTYASASGDFAVGHRVQALIEPVVAAEEVAPAHRFLWRVWLGYFLMMIGEYTEAEANYRMGMVINDENQFPWSANLLFVRALCIIGGGELPDALPSLDGMEAATNRSRPQDLGYLHVAHAWKAMIVGDPEMARRESEAALTLAQEVGNFSLTIVWQTPRMWALALTDQYDEFVHSMDDTLRRVRGTCYRRPHVEWLAMKAWLHLRRGENDAAQGALAEALSMAKALAHGAFFHRLCRFAPELRAFAVASQADPDFVRSLIRKFRWPAPSQDAEGWPWPIRVYTLGQFKICLDGKPLAFSRKTPKKPVALLKTIVAFGGESVPEERLVDALWPDESGDAAYHAFSLALHRLRRLLADPEAIRVADGTVSLDPDRVWTDVRAFDVITGDAARPGSEAASRVTALYRGNFLPEESEQAWSVSLRERLRAKFLNAVDRHGQALERTDELDRAAALYLRGLDAEPLAESFYQGLMRCYMRQGRHAEALGTYRRLRQMLSVVLGIRPSALTESLVRALQVR